MDLLNSLVEFLMPTAEAAPAAQPDDVRVGSMPDQIRQQPAPSRVGQFATPMLGATPDGVRLGSMPNPTFGGLADQIRQSLVAGNPEPRRPVPYQPPTQPPAPAPRTSGWATQAAGPAADPAPASAGITAGDVQRFIRSVSAGAASANPSSSKLSALMQGAAGSTNHSYAEERAGQARNDKVNEQRRVADLRLDREGRLQQRDIMRDDRDQRRDARADRMDARREQSMTVGDKLREAQLKRITDPQLDNKDKIALERLVRDKSRDLQRDVDAFRVTKEDAKTKLDEYKKQIEADFNMKRAQKVAPQSPGAGDASAPLLRHNGKLYKFNGYGADGQPIIEEVRQ